MKTKKVESTEDAVQSAPIAAKPLTKTSRVATAKPAEKKTQSVKAVKTAQVAEAVSEPVVVAKDEKSAKKPKLKVVRDSFTMPQNEYQKIAQIKEVCLKSGMQVKKSEVLRAGVIALAAMNEAQLGKAMSALDKIKTGRPNKH